MGIERILKEARLRANYTQAELATGLGYSTSQYVSNWERGRCVFPASRVGRFCKMTGMSVRELRNLLNPTNNKK